MPCALAESGTSSRNARTRSPAAPPRAATAGDHQPFDRAVYKKRNVVERCFNRLKQWRDLATRYAKRASLYRAGLVLIATIIWLS
ncbi:hypothetical protein Pen02_81000 [Plantactinospora endophytica]|uniref:Transposase DDE domain-containing protein n=1 Tax=Plantactinospora endophytica TaxID=673535 RepID=A0ABQ4EEP4_9ACTN|nr:hypothetical protein Pen02_81000 [Plantactinospora endophytica]